MRERLWNLLRAIHDRLHEESEAAETQAIGFVLSRETPEPPPTSTLFDEWMDWDGPDDPDDAPESSRRGVRRPGSIGTAGRGSKRKGGPARGL